MTEAGGRAGLLESADRLYGRLLLGVASLGAAVLLGLVVLVTLDVALRAGFGGGVVGAVEWAEIGLYVATVAAAPWLLHRNAHIRADVVLQALPLRIGWALELLGEVLVALVLAVLFVHALGVVEQSRTLGSMVRRAINFAEWWWFAPLPACLGLLFGASLFRIARLVTGPRRPSAADLSAA